MTVPKLPAVRINETSVAESDCEYYSVEEDLTVKMVFRNEERCPVCKQDKSVFVLPVRAPARCWDCHQKESGK